MSWNCGVLTAFGQMAKDDFLENEVCWIVWTFKNSIIFEEGRFKEMDILGTM